MEYIKKKYNFIPRIKTKIRTVINMRSRYQAPKISCPRFSYRCRYSYFRSISDSVTLNVAQFSLINYQVKRFSVLHWPDIIQLLQFLSYRCPLKRFNLINSIVHSFCIYAFIDDLVVVYCLYKLISLFQL